MRLRNIPGAEEKIEASPFVVQSPERYQGQWKAALFGNDRPLHVEIGCGKGAFLMTLAARHPEINFLGVERMSTVLLRAIEKRETAEDLPNLYFLRFDAENITDVFAPGEVDRIYLNFSDPWPKDRHHKRRLTDREFLARYEKILAPGGKVEFKTDNAALFDFSLEELAARGWKLLAETRDLHKSPMNEGNVMTEYEERFSLLGNKILKLEAAPGGEDPDPAVQANAGEEKTPAGNRAYKILVINPGSTSTKVSLFENERSVFERSLFHDAPELLKFPHVNDQVPFREGVILEMLKEEGVRPEEIDVFVGRGGSAYSQPGGVTVIDGRLYDDTVKAVGGSEHPAKLGVMIAWEMARKLQKKAYTLNPTNVDEYQDTARLTGIKGLYRVSHSHVLNQKAVADYHAKKNGRRYEDCNFIVAHIDGGITVSAHEKGRMIDGNMGADGEGAFTPTRIGSVPVLQLLDYIEAHSVAEARLMCARSGGFVSLFGTADSDAIHKKVEEGDRKATLVWNTMIYQIVKMIGEMAAVLSGKVDGILLTGGLMRFDDIREGIERHCGFIAPVTVYPGEMEQEALAYAVLEVLRGEKEARTYTGKPVFDGFPGLDL